MKRFRLSTLLIIFADLKKFVYITLVIAIFFGSSCNSTDQILKSSDSNLKYTKAMEWYSKGQYFKAIPVFEELMGLFKGEKSTEELYYYYCMANFKQESFLMSAFHFKNFTTKHPYSKYTEEALFMHAESYKEQTLIFSLDQSETVKAIAAYQSFINTYPDSDKVKNCNNRIDELRERLEKKALKAAELYYKTQNYRAAALSYKNLLFDYPDIDGVKDIQYKIVKSYLKYADQSIVEKQKERYEQSIKAANVYMSKYPESEATDQVKMIKEEATFNILKSNYELAMSSPLDKRMGLLNDMEDLYAMYKKDLKVEQNIEAAKEYMEKTDFQKIKTQYSLAQENATKDRAKFYQKAIEEYNSFSTKYNTSKYLNEAKRIFSASEKNYKKHTHG